MDIRDRLGLAGTLLIAAMAIFWIGPSEAASLPCGTVGQSLDPAKTVRADLTPTTPQNVITLGRGIDGYRSWVVEFGWTADCTLEISDISPILRSFQGTDASIDVLKIQTSVAIDSDAHRVLVTLKIPRDRRDIPAGKFEGTIEVGSGKVGLGTAAVTVRHQEPVVLTGMSGAGQIVWTLFFLLLGVLLLLVAPIKHGTFERHHKRTSQDFATPSAVIFMGLALYPALVHLLGSSSVKMPWWPIWLGIAGLVGGFMIAVVKHRAGARSLKGGYPFASAIFLSFGAGITAWRAQYVNSPDWALTIESGLGLLGVVGGATATSALLLLQPTSAPDPNMPDPDLPAPPALPPGPVVRRPARRRTRSRAVP